MTHYVPEGVNWETLNRARNHRERLMSCVMGMPEPARSMILSQVATACEQFKQGGEMGMLAWGLLAAEFTVCRIEQILHGDPSSIVENAIRKAKGK